MITDFFVDCFLHKEAMQKQARELELITKNQEVMATNWHEWFAQHTTKLDDIKTTNDEQATLLTQHKNQSLAKQTGMFSGVMENVLSHTHTHTHTLVLAHSRLGCEKQLQHIPRLNDVVITLTLSHSIVTKDSRKLRRKP